MNQYNPQIHHRRSIRLKGYDYTQCGAYFVTICTQGRVCLFGDVMDGEMVLNPFGRVVATYWERLPRHFPRVQLGTWVVMPNHVHGIIIITDDDGGGGRGEAFPQSSMMTMRAGNAQASGRQGIGGECLAPTTTTMTATPTTPNGAPPGSVGAIVGNVKSTITRRINQMRHTPGADVWQRNYWEHIILSPEAHARIEDYILVNPARWRADDLHPDAPPNPFNQES
jgi:putative transposase